MYKLSKKSVLRNAGAQRLCKKSDEKIVVPCDLYIREILDIIERSQEIYAQAYEEIERQKSLSQHRVERKED